MNSISNTFRISRILIALFWAIILTLISYSWQYSPLVPQAVNDAASQAVNGNETAFQASRLTTEATTNGAAAALSILWGMLVLWFLWPVCKFAAKKPAGMAIVVLSLCSCQPYNVPEFKEVKPNETAFLVPLEDDSHDQAKFNSEAYLEKAKVAAKRIEIPHRWNQTGRGSGEGEWIATHRLILVSRAPITREWTAHTSTGTAAKDEAFHTESRDSVNFLVGAAVTAYIAEDDTAKFLYLTGTDSLETVLDTEVRNRVQSVITEFTAKTDLETLRSQKADMLTAIRADVIPFFKTRGVTIMTVSLASGFDYENKEIQNSIDKVFQAQQLKQISKAELEAQKDANAKIQMAAEAQAAAKLSVAKAEAESIKILNDAVASGKNMSAVWLKAIEKWDGRTPYFFGGSNGLPFTAIPTETANPTSAQK